MSDEKIEKLRLDLEAARADVATFKRRFNDGVVANANQAAEITNLKAMVKSLRERPPAPLPIGNYHHDGTVGIPIYTVAALIVAALKEQREEE